MDLSLIPWPVRDEHRDTYIYRMLERESLLRDGLPCGTQEELEALEQWKATLDRAGVVVTYVPAHRDGFVLVYAKDGERGQIILRPEPV
ncbi:hypothetical protein [Brachybacterium sp. YJGR34]|uniref:hypothetical protein n=1 Tax=Brachybacterium sp. YJGR34 TaxID=2059911 RepID=UPI000E0BA9FD|nr:hypothetical protein [Brachybacterium sp. YJGR34]